MQRPLKIAVAGFALAIGAGGGYWYIRQPAGEIAQMIVPQSIAATPDRKILYYRDPSGAPYWSATPKKNSAGGDYAPVYADEEASFGPGGELIKNAAQNGAPDKMPMNASANNGASRKLLYYRNPMGLPDTSPVPKKDSMGMDYIAVYEDEQDSGDTVRVSPDRIQRSGVRTETAQERTIVQPVRAIGSVTPDESRLTVVTMRSDGYIEELYINKSGQHVEAGEPLFRVYSPDIVSAQVNLRNGGGGGGEQRLRNFGVPESHIREVLAGGNPMSLVWPSPASGEIIQKQVINGQKVRAGDEIYRIADLSQVWVIADVAEGDLPAIKIGTGAVVTVRAYRNEPIEGKVTFIYPELRAQTRTARVRIEVPNTDGRLKGDMYADVVFQTGSDAPPAVAVPVSAVIDSGNRQVVLVAKGEGRFEPRTVNLGRRGDGYVEVREGIKAGEEVVTAATFLIDAESNLKAALKNFTQQESMK
jgi:Cu(I)/Ag(I) efflux system membrane fusion protein